MSPTELVLHFSDFSMIFSEFTKKSAKALYYFSYQFAVRPLKRISPLQCGPRERRHARVTQFRRGPAAGLAGDVRGVVLGWLGTGFGRSPGRWGSWRSRATVAAAAGRGMPCSGEPPAGARELAVRSTTVEGRGGLRTVARLRKSVETRLGGDDHGTRRRSEKRWPTVRHVRRGRPSFIVDAGASSGLAGGRQWCLGACAAGQHCRMDLLGPTTSVGTRTDYSVGPWDYPTCAPRHLLA
jgi:hypothetical protein